MGYLRFILACLVASSHIGTGIIDGWNRFNLGVFAVVMFYLLAGHVINHIINDVAKFKDRENFFKVVKNYYLDRFLRIFPLYIFACFITLVFVSITNFGNPEIKIVNLFNNLVLIPLNYYMFINDYIVVLKGLNLPNGWYLVPQAWSLGAEFQVYLIFPFLIKFYRLRILAFITSFLIFLLANLNIFNPDYWGYRLLPGIIFIFITGSILQDIAKKNVKRLEIYLIIFTYIFFSLFFVISVLKNSYSIFTRETILGYVVGIPLILFLLRNKPKLPLNKTMGKLSYGVFLFHFLFIWIFKYIGFMPSPILYTMMILILSVAVSYLGILLIENKIENIRMGIYKRF